MAEEKNENEKAEQPKEAPAKVKKINLIYDALLLYSAGKEINEASVKKVAEATGAKVEDTQIKALVAALDGVDINDAISKAAIMPSVAGPVAASESGKEAAKEEKSAEEMEKKAEEAAEGLSSLFG